MPPEYSAYTNVFSSNMTMEFPKNTSINKYTIKLVEKKQSSYEPIYTLRLIELETLKTYIEIHLKTGYIWSSKFPTEAPILFNKKLDNSLCLFVDYRDLNNLTIRNRYLLPVIGATLDQLDWAK